MEEDDGVKRTIECLRGRLVAERQNSRTAQENADRLCEKLKELENKLKEEAEMKNRAEKKLSFLEGRLASVKSASRSSEDSEQQQLSSSMSENSVLSCESSTVKAADSGSIKLLKREMFDSRVRTEVLPVKLDCNAQEITEPKLKNAISLTEDDMSFSVTEVSSPACHEKLSLHHEDFQSEDHWRCPEQGNGEEVDNSLALVPVDNAVPEESRAREPMIVSRNVSEVLEALRLAREGIQRRMRQKQKCMIEFGVAPTQAC